MEWPKSSRAYAGSAKFVFRRARMDLFWRCGNRSDLGSRWRHACPRRHRPDLAACGPGWVRRSPSLSGRWCPGRLRFWGTEGDRGSSPIIPRAPPAAGTMAGAVEVGARAAGGDVGSWRAWGIWQPNETVTSGRKTCSKPWMACPTRASILLDWQRARCERPPQTGLEPTVEYEVAWETVRYAVIRV